MTMYPILLRIGLLSVLISTLACSNLLEPTPKGQVEVDTYYANFNGLLGGINGCYNSLGNVYSRGDTGDQLFIDVLSDDATSFPYRNTEVGTWETISVVPNNSGVQKWWTNNYTGIYRCNVIIEKAPAASLTTADQKLLGAQFVGEAKLLRAYFYFNLVRLFGDVPLTTTAESDPTKLSLPRSTTDQIYTQIEADLKDALVALPVRHPDSRLIRTANLAGGYEIGRATVGSAKALLSMMYLTRQRWAEAATQASDIVNSGVYSLNLSYADNFPARSLKENTPESVFEVQYAAGNSGTGGSNEGFAGATDAQANGGNGYLRPTDNADGLTNSIRQVYSTTDDRLATAMTTTFPGAGGLLLVNKYLLNSTIANNATNRSNSGNNFPVYRLAEILLIQAEALNETGDTKGAWTALKKVRDRAKLTTPDVTTYTQATLRDAIRQERRLELSFECKRWFDLNRWGITTPVMTAHGRPMQDFQKLLPIPQTELDRNGNMKQTQGY